MRILDQLKLASILNIPDDLIEGIRRILDVIFFFLFRLGIVFFNRPHNIFRQTDDRINRISSQNLNIIDHKNIERVRHCQGQMVPHQRNRYDLVFDCGFFGDNLDDLRVNFKTVNIDRRET